MRSSNLALSSGARPGARGMHPPSADGGWRSQGGRGRPWAGWALAWLAWQGISPVPGAGPEGAAGSTLGLHRSGYPVFESQGYEILAVRRSGDRSSAVSVEYRTEDITARAGEDYVATQGTLHFAPGEGAKTIRVDVVNDGVREGGYTSPERFRVLLSTPSGGVSLSPAIATVAIADNDPGFHFVAAEYDEPEGERVARIPVLRGHDGTFPCSVGYASEPLQAIPGEDCELVSGRLEFGADDRVKYIAVPLHDDAVREGVERLRLRLSEPEGGGVLATNWPVVTTVRIVDDDQGVALVASALRATEDAGTVLVGIRRGSDTAMPLAVTWAVTGGSATPGEDFEPATGRVDIAAGQEEGTFPIRVLDDGLREGNETVVLRLVGIDPDHPIAASATVLTLEDNDSGVRFASASCEIGEGESGWRVTVVRGVDRAFPFTVDVATEPGSALAGEDYTAVSETVAFAAEETEKTIRVPVLDDVWPEDRESLSLVLSNPTGEAMQGNPSRTSLSVLDDDAGLVASVTPFLAGEDEGSVTVVVRWEGAASVLPFSVDYETADRTARAGEDFEARSGRLDFTVGQPEARLQIPLLNDDTPEAVETFRVGFRRVDAPVVPSKGLWVMARIRDEASSTDGPDLRRLGATLSDGGPRLEWPNAQGWAFRVETSETLAPPQWRLLAQVTTDAATGVWVDETGGAANRFYRVVAVDDAGLELRLQQALEEAVRAQSLPGGSAVLISAGGEWWSGTCGDSWRGTESHPIRPQMRYAIASISKTFIATLTLLLVEEGRLSLDTRMDEVLPEIVDDHRILSRLTIRQLLDHSNGLGGWWDGGDDTAYWQAVGEDPTSVGRKGELVAFLSPPRFPPGTRVEYGTSAYLLLGLVAEKVMGRPVEEQLRERLYRPLGLHGTSMGGVDPLIGECVVGHNWSTGEWTDMKMLPGEPLNLHILGVGHGWTGAGMIASVEDLARWAHALYGARVLSESALRFMTTAQPGAPRSTCPWGSSELGASCVIMDTPDGRMYGHGGGGVTGALTQIMHSAEHGYTLALAVNEGEAAMDRRDHVFKALLETLRDAREGTRGP